MSECTRCGKPITFKKTSQGKWAPVDLDGTNNFQTCHNQMYVVITNKIK